MSPHGEENNRLTLNVVTNVRIAIRSDLNNQLLLNDRPTDRRTVGLVN